MIPRISDEQLAAISVSLHAYEHELSALVDEARASRETIPALVKIIEGLVDQQAMPDDWWESALAAALNPEDR